MSYKVTMRTTKTAIQVAELNAAIDTLTQAVRRLKNAGEPVLLMRVSALLKDLMIKKLDTRLAQ